MKTAHLSLPSAFPCLRQFLVTSASEIRRLKRVRDLTQRAGGSAAEIQSSLAALRRETRHRHIALCELRGVPRERIEQPRPENVPSEAWIERIKQEALAEFAA